MTSRCVRATGPWSISSASVATFGLFPFQAGSKSLSTTGHALRMSLKAKSSGRSQGREKYGVAASHKTWSGTSSEAAARGWAWSTLHRTDLRRTCAKLCHDRGGELEQIQFLLGHASVQT